MSVPQVTEKRATTDVVVELTRNQVPPFLPSELSGYVTPLHWENRVSFLTQMAGQYCRPAFERIFLLILMLLTLIVPITTYYVTIHMISDQSTNDFEAEVWYARLVSFGVTVATWILLSVPMLFWKYTGRTKVARAVDRWTKQDARSAETFAAALIWRASVPGLFGECIVLTVTVPASQKSIFDPEGFLPPYISASEDAAPPYSTSRMSQWSRDGKGGLKYGDIPIYEEHKVNLA